MMMMMKKKKPLKMTKEENQADSNESNRFDDRSARKPQLQTYVFVRVHARVYA